MFLRFGRSTQPYALLIVTLVMGVFWFTMPVNGEYCNAPSISIYRWINHLSESTTFLSRLTGFASLLFMASLVIQLNTKYLFIGQRSYLPGMLFLLLSLLIHKAQNFHPVCWAGILLLFALDRLIGTYRYDGLSYQVFDAAFLTGLAAIFYPPVFFLLLFFLLALPILRPFYWREWALIIIGMLLPFYFTYALLYIFDKPESSSFLSSYIGLLGFACPGLNPPTVERIVFFYMIFIFFLSTFYLLRIMGNIKILTRKSFYLFFILLFNLILLYWFVPQAGKEIFILMAIPVSYIMAFYFQGGKPTRIRVILFDVLVVSIILIRYLH